MNPNNAIEVSNLCKKFDIKNTTFYGGQSKIGTKQVLDNLTFNVNKGQIFGIIGRNGSGKSTLLKIIAKIMYPDSGEVKVDGQVASILELGMGFEPELSGKDNIIVKSKMYGLNDNEIKQRINEIIQFSELGEQIEFPLRTYSSGMVAKLAFSIIAFVKCNILIVDEVLSVGDASFNFKCKLMFEQMRKERKTVIIASHNLSTLENFCDTVIWIEEGKAKEIGDATTVCNHFYRDSIESPDTLKKLADSGDSISMNRLATLYLKGINIEKNIEKAEELFKKSIEMGNTDAKVALGDLLISQGKFENAQSLFESAAQDGNLDAIMRVYRNNDDETED